MNITSSRELNITSLNTKSLQELIANEDKQGVPVAADHSLIIYSTTRSIEQTVQKLVKMVRENVYT
jgi:hypothetical protein